jgi:DNA-binding NtrC family response regulator
MEPSKLIGFVVDADAVKRSRCAEAARGDGAFKKILTLASPRDFQARIEEGQVCDVLFLGQSLSSDMIIEIIAAAKKTNEDIACIAVVGSADQQVGSVAAQVVGGVDGFLCEPFSVDGVLLVARIALRLKAQNQEKRVKVAIALMIEDVLSNLDLASVALYQSKSPASIMKQFKEVSNSLKSLNEESTKFYFETLIERTEEYVVPAERKIPKGPRSIRKDRNAARWDKK